MVSYGFSSSHVRMWELDNKKGWAPKNWCFWTVVQEKTPESPLDSKEIKPVNPKRNQPWILEGLILKLRYLGHLMWRANSLEKKKTLMLGKVEGRRTGWQMMRWVDGITDSMDMGFLQALGDGEGQGNLACCSPWSCRVGHAWATEQLQLVLGATASDNKLFNQSEITWGKLLPAV